jgi:hypothetical protein
VGYFICANWHACLAIIYQSVVATGQLQLQLLSANIVNDVDTKRLGTIATAAGMIARLAYARVRQAGIELDSLLKNAALTEQQMTDRGAGAGVKKGHERELRAKQEKQDKSPLRDFSRRGIAYRVMRVIWSSPVD